MKFHPVRLNHVLLSYKCTQVIVQFEVSAPHIVYAALGGFVVLVSPLQILLAPVVSFPPQFGMFSLFIREKVCFLCSPPPALGSQAAYSCTSGRLYGRFSSVSS